MVLTVLLVTDCIYSKLQLFGQCIYIDFKIAETIMNTNVYVYICVHKYWVSCETE